MCNDTSTDRLVRLFNSVIAYVEPDIAAKRVGENNAQLFLWHWAGDDESIHPIVTSFVERTVLSMLTASISSLPDPGQNI